MRAPGGGGSLGVGIVVVSHSRALATAAVALAGEMVHGAEPRIAIAAGLDETTFGTDAVQIAAAIEKVDGEAGVVVLMDLGSAVLSAEFALDLLPDDDVRGRVLLCPAPLVEGLVVAAVAAAGGASRQEVADEARAALLAKAAHLSPETAAAAPDTVAGAVHVAAAAGMAAASEAAAVATAAARAGYGRMQRQRAPRPQGCGRGKQRRALDEGPAARGLNVPQRRPAALVFRPAAPCGRRTTHFPACCLAR